MYKQPWLFPVRELTFISRKRRSAAEKLADKIRRTKAASYERPAELFGRFLDLRGLKQTAEGRDRMFTPATTFWAFLSQILSADGSCVGAVRNVQATAASRKGKVPSGNTAAYCNARKRLPFETILSMLHSTVLDADRQPERLEGFEQHRVIVVDGTTVSMPDTPENRAEWPQPAGQKAGCGFPYAKLLCAFYLNSGALMDFAIGDKHSGEIGLLRDLQGSFRKGDILLGDRAFCSYCDIASFRMQGVDSVVRLHQSRQLGRARKCFSKSDKLYTWNRPKGRPAGIGKPEWEEIPKTMEMRVITVRVKQPAHRTKLIELATTLTDPVAYPAERIAAMYLARWRAELHLRDIKTTMGMEILRCKSPAMIRKELLMYFIAYNCIRLCMWEAAGGREAWRMSFKATCDAIAAWEPMFEGLPAKRRKELLREFERVVLKSVLPQRPARREPRVLKRRPKNYQLMTKPRAEMVEIQHRSSYKAKAS